jgi:hypothetical protein
MNRKKLQMKRVTRRFIKSLRGSLKESGAMKALMKARK